jgi:hypothetical protein
MTSAEMDRIIENSARDARELASTAPQGPVEPESAAGAEEDALT